jgi:hypothetical protein
MLEELIDLAYNRYYRTASLLGTPDERVAYIAELEVIGVTEIACLIDFGVETDKVLAALASLDRLQQLCRPQSF